MEARRTGKNPTGVLDPCRARHHLLWAAMVLDPYGAQLYCCSHTADLYD